MPALRILLLRLLPPNTSCSPAPRPSGPLQAPVASSSASGGKPCTMTQAACGHLSSARPAQTAWTASHRGGALLVGMRLGPALTPSLPPSTQHGGRQTQRVRLHNCHAPSSIPLPPQAPTLIFAGAQEERGPVRPPPSAWPLPPAPECPNRAMRLRGYPASFRHRPWHAMPRPGRTGHVAPRHPERDFAPCRAQGGHCLRPRATPH
jgi:hypothetical protein